MKAKPSFAIAKSNSYLSSLSLICEIPVGTKAVYPRGNQLAVDLDTEEGVRQFMSLLVSVDRFYDIRGLRIWPSRSKGAHALVTLGEEMTSEIQVVLQAVLGSDPLREFLGLQRMRINKPLNVLFKPLRTEEGL